MSEFLTNTTTHLYEDIHTYKVQYAVPAQQYLGSLLHAIKEGKVLSTSVSVHDQGELWIHCFHLIPFNLTVGVPHLSVVTLLATLSMLGLSRQKISVDFLGVLSYSPLIRLCSPACGVEGCEGRQTHSSYG